jgi:hypothetical protein
MRRGRLLAAASVAASAIVGAAACVDLFHSTSFETLCDRDAAACGANPGDAGAPDAAPSLPTDVCAWSAADVDTAATRACAWLGACGGTGLGPCIVRAREALDCRFNPVLRPSSGLVDLWRCLTRVTSCSDVGQCLFVDVHPVCEPAPNKRSRCVGASLVECLPGTGESRPVDGIESCALEGRSCIEGSTPQTALCAGAQKTGCAAGAHCIDSFVSVCDGFLDVGHDCASFGAGGCVAGDGGAACTPGADAAACSAPAALRCDDAGVAHSCVGGHEVVYDCNALGVGCTPDASASDPLLACQDVAGTAGHCASDDLCDGDRLTSCAQGRPFTIECSAYGLGPCRISPSPTIGSCAPPR